MRTYSQDEIEQRGSELADKITHANEPDLVIDDPVLGALFDVASDPRATDADVDAAVAAARAAGCTWDDISPVLHASRPTVPNR